MSNYEPWEQQLPDNYSKCLCCGEWHHNPSMDTEKELHEYKEKVAEFRKWVWNVEPIFHLNNEMYCDGYSDSIVQVQLKLKELFGEENKE